MRPITYNEMIEARVRFCKNCSITHEFTIMNSFGHWECESKDGEETRPCPKRKEINNWLEPVKHNLCKAHARNFRPQEIGEITGRQSCEICQEK